MAGRGAAILIVAAVVVAFAPLLAADFVRWDDLETVALNPRLNPPSVEGLAYHWTRPHMDLYVPVTYTWWAAVAAVARTGVADPEGITLNPLVFHAANVLVHLAATLVLWRVLLVLTCRTGAATVGALVFALHPVQVEPVGWVSGAKDLLAGFFCLVAIWQYVEAVRASGGRRRVHYGVALGAYVLAMLSKPAAVTAPVAIAAIDWWLLRRSWRETVRWLWPWAVVALPVVVVTKLVQPSPGTYTPPVWARPLIAADALAAYVGKVLLPFRLSIDYGRTPQWLLGSSQRFWTWVVPAVVGVACVVWRRRFPWLMAGAVVAVAFVAPVLGIVKFDFQRHSTVADHYLYTAMAGVALAVSYAMSRTTGRGAYVVAGVVLAVLGVRTMAQAVVWRESMSLFSNAVRVNATSLAGHNGLGDLALQEKRYEDAARHFRAAVDAHPGDVISNYNLGNALLLAGRPREAVAPYRVAIAGGRDYPFMFVNLAGALARAGDVGGALAVSEQGLERWPDSAELLLTRATLLAAGGDLDGAAEDYEAALRLKPNLAPAREGLAEVRRRGAASRPAARP